MKSSEPQKNCLTSSAIRSHLEIRDEVEYERKQ